MNPRYPHRAFLPTDLSPKEVDRLVPPPPLPNEPEVRGDWANYQASIQYVDGLLERIFRELASGPRRDDTLVILTTDHGIAFPEMKCCLKDGGIGVALLLDYPGNPARGEALDGLVSHLDLFPTICDLLGLDRPDHLQGESLLPLLEKRTDRVRGEVFAEVTFHAAYEPMRAVRDERYKYIRRFGHSRRPLSNCDGSPTKKWYLSQGWGEEPLAGEELYDLQKDPLETVNLTADPAYAPILETMRKRLRQWMEETEDPLLHGPVEPPPGGQINTSG